MVPEGRRVEAVRPGSEFGELSLGLFLTQVCLVVCVRACPEPGVESWQCPLEEQCDVSGDPDVLVHQLVNVLCGQSGAFSQLGLPNSAFFQHVPQYDSGVQGPVGYEFFWLGRRHHPASRSPDTPPTARSVIWSRQTSAARRWGVVTGSPARFRAVPLSTAVR